MSADDMIWKQSEKEENKVLEISVPIILPPGGRPKELTVEIKDGEVLVVKHKGLTTLLQWRLLLKVEEELQWEVADGRLNVYMTKRDADTWPSLLNLPIPPTHACMMTRTELDQLLSEELPPLPDDESPKKASAATTEGGDKKNDEEVDLDAMLEEAADIAGSPVIQIELDARKKEQEELEKMELHYQTQLKELSEEAAVPKKTEEIDDADEPSSPPKPEDDSKASQREAIEKQLEKIRRIKAITEEISIIRRQPTTLDGFAKVQALDIRKGRVAGMEFTENEAEVFASADEAKKEPKELMKGAVEALRAEKMEVALHLLRCAALHHKHPPSCVFLYRLYSEMGNFPKAAYFIINRADGDDMDQMTNHLVAECHDRGFRHFPPLMALAVYRHQRAACAGSTAAMMSLASLFQRGGCSASVSTEKMKDMHKNIARFKQWLQMAADRGSPSAYYSLAHLHMRGDMEYPKSYATAKAFFDKAYACNPDFKKLQVNVDDQLEALRIEEGGAPKSNATSPKAGAAGSRSPVKLDDIPGATTGGGNNAHSKLQTIAARTGATAKSMMDKPPTAGSGDHSSKMAAGLKRKQFWEKMVRVGVACYCTYSLCFPIRAILLPQWYMFIAYAKDVMGGGGGGGGMMMPRGGGGMMF